LWNNGGGVRRLGFALLVDLTFVPAGMLAFNIVGGAWLAGLVLSAALSYGLSLWSLSASSNR
jgi:hypothetical protein